MCHFNSVFLGAVLSAIGGIQTAVPSISQSRYLQAMQYLPVFRAIHFNFVALVWKLEYNEPSLKRD